MKSTEEFYRKMAAEIGSILATKEKAYGFSYATSPQVLEILFPNGVNVKDYDKLLYITRVIDKLNRIANNDNTEDPYQDICGYSLLAMRQRNKN